jgi:hypothetical protein
MEDLSDVELRKISQTPLAPPSSAAWKAFFIRTSKANSPIGSDKHWPG